MKEKEIVEIANDFVLLEVEIKNLVKMRAEQKYESLYGKRDVNEYAKRIVEFFNEFDRVFFEEKNPNEE